MRNRELGSLLIQRAIYESDFEEVKRVAHRFKISQDEVLIIIVLANAAYLDRLIQRWEETLDVDQGELQKIVYQELKHELEIAIKKESTTN